MNKPRLLLLVPAALLLNSCASVLLNSHSVFRITTDKPATITVNGDTLTAERSQKSLAMLEARAASAEIVNTCGLKDGLKQFAEEVKAGRAAAVTLRRSKQPLTLGITADSVNRTYSVEPSLDPTFWINAAMPPLMLIDAFSDKKYYYKNITVRLDYDVLTYTRYDNDKQRIVRTPKKDLPYGEFYKKGRFLINLHLPWANIYCTQTKNNGHKSGGGFWGAGVGFEYLYTDRHSLNVEVSGIINCYMPLPLPITGLITYAFQNEYHNRINFSLLNNHHFKRFSIGYGVNLAHNRWRYYKDKDEDKDGSKNENEPEIKPLTSIERGEKMLDKHWSLGPVVNAFWKAGLDTRLGLAYRPSIYRTGYNPQWIYEHSISLELRLSINTGKKVVSTQRKGKWH